MLGVMYLLSTELFTSANTLRFLRAILGASEGGDSSVALRRTNFAIRKSAHVIEYAVLAILLYYAVRRGRSERWRWSWAFAALGIAAGCAMLDEWHQSFAAGRTSTVADVLLDAGGACLGLSFLWLFFRWPRK